MSLPAVSHRDLAVAPHAPTRKIRNIFKFSIKQRKEMEKVRKTTYGKERATAVAALAKEWGAPVGSIMYRIYKGGAPRKAQVQRRNAAPVQRKRAEKPTRPQKMEGGNTTKLKFRIKSLEINNGEITMTLIS